MLNISFKIIIFMAIINNNYFVSIFLSCSSFVLTWCFVYVFRRSEPVELF